MRVGSQGNLAVWAQVRYGGEVFSIRTAWSRVPNRWSIQAERSKKVKGLVDLSSSNPTQVGLGLPTDVLEALANPEGRFYRPEPLGVPSARDAISEYYQRRGVDVDPDRVVVTATTSEAYAFVFRLLLDPGGQVMVPEPSYPLLPFLVDLGDLAMSPYRLRWQGRWALDRSTLSNGGAIVAVQPNNPTGSVLSSEERRSLVEHAVQHQAAIVSDEVFLDYLVDPQKFSSATSATQKRVLTFTLSGLSKVAGLPQLKLSWIVVSGPAGPVQEALARLEVMADTFLSVSTPVQLALGRLLKHAESFQVALRARLAGNRRRLAKAILPHDGGWNAILPLSAGKDDEAITLALAQDRGVLVQPGCLYDLDFPALVISLLPDESTFSAGLTRILAHCNATSIGVDQLRSATSMSC